jgi:hypothetical protein
MTRELVGKQSRRYEDTIKMCVTEMGYKDASSE